MITINRDKLIDELIKIYKVVCDDKSAVDTLVMVRNAIMRMPIESADPHKLDIILDQINEIRRDVGAIFIATSFLVHKDDEEEEMGDKCKKF